MNVENISPTPIIPIPQPVPRKPIDLVKEKVKNFTQNKRLLGLIFIILIAGVIFSFLNKRVGPKILTSPAPHATQTFKNPEANESAEKLKSLKEKIFNLDIYQKRLSPPNINFDITF